MEAKQVMYADIELSIIKIKKEIKEALNRREMKGRPLSELKIMNFGRYNGTRLDLENTARDNKSFLTYVRSFLKPSPRLHREGVLSKKTGFWIEKKYKELTGNELDKEFRI